MMGANWYEAQFPEALYIPDAIHQDRYRYNVTFGYEVAKLASVTICGIIQDDSNNIFQTASRIKQLSRFFRKTTVNIYENDSVNDMSLMLKNAFYGFDVNIKHDTLDNRSHMNTEHDKNVYRAQARNKYLTPEMESDFVIVVDFNVLGGWSYEGVLNSLGQANLWDVCVSNSFLYKNNERQHYDKAFKMNMDTTKFRRGEALVPVTSGFGGLTLYHSETFHDKKYKDYTNPHNTIIDQCLEDGGSVVLNPSQICSYTKFWY